MNKQNVLKQNTCKQCGWKWYPRVPHTMICPNPKCHSVYWNVSKKPSKYGCKGVK